MRHRELGSSLLQCQATPVPISSIIYCGNFCSPARGVLGQTAHVKSGRCCSEETGLFKDMSARQLSGISAAKPWAVFGKCMEYIVIEFS
jgi:hypothetical protein